MNVRLTQRKPWGPSLVGAGAKLGFLAGLGLSIAYAILATAITGVLLYGPSGLALPLLLLFGAPLIGLYAILPAILYGVFTGVLLGFMAERTQGKISRWALVGICIVTCVVIALLSHYLLQIYVTLSFDEPILFTKATDTIANARMHFAPFDSYPFYIGIPTIIYIWTGGWAGWRLYRQAGMTKSQE